MIWDAISPILTSFYWRYESRHMIHMALHWPQLSWWLVMAYFVQGHLRPSPSVTGPLFAKRTALLSQDPWWRHQMETFSALLAICAGNSPGTGEFPAQRPVTRSFEIFFDLCPNKPLSKQWWGWWFETLSRPFWRYCNALEVSKPRDWML